MKKAITFLLALTLLFALCACGAASAPSAPAPAEPAPAPAEPAQSEPEEPAAPENERQIADVFEYATIEGEDNMVWGYIFEEDVTVTGDNGRVIFANCEFKKNIYNCCGEGGKVVLDDACIFADSSECILNSTLKEAGDDTDLPKFLYFCEGVKVTCEGCGAAVTYANIPIVFNGETYPIDTADFFMDETSGVFEPYSGQEGANVHNRCQYYQNGELVEMHVAVQAAM